MKPGIEGRKVVVKGIVQGVGFRPYIYGLAMNHHVTGWVRNTSSGVEIEVNGSPDQLSSFLEAIPAGLPPLARIDFFHVETVPPNGTPTFEILFSQAVAGEYIPISPDVATCPACQAELFDPTNRRYRYPFINCTHCGPRFTIIQDIPYDRPKTTMAGFPMCPECAREYHDPLDRRFHAQPTACPVCGPQVELVSSNGDIAKGDEAILQAREILRQGKILAIKGLGGYHLACDAFNAQAVDALRQRKKRSDKPFALMAFDLGAITRHTYISPQEQDLLLSRQRPIVLLERKPSSTIVPQTAPHQTTLGMMLAYTPLHLLLLEPEPRFPEILVMTSGNLSDEPIAYTDSDARERLNSIADAFLTHNRAIHMRVDDSVTRIIDHSTYFIRRSRGFAPDAIPLSTHVAPVLATGAELKNTFCLGRDQYAFLSHHIGDMENLETYQSFEEGIAHFERLFRIQPQAVACDLHPDYLATQYARNRTQTSHMPLIEVQHHHAHLAACLADNQWKNPEPVIGLIYDGTGYGTDGAIWGGEVLLGGIQGYSRPYHLAYVPLPGGDASVRKVARMALAHLWQSGLDWESDLPPVQALSSQERDALRTQLDHRLNTPLTSSMGRLFDAAAALMGVRQNATYEGQAAIELEALVDPEEPGVYTYEIADGQIGFPHMWVEMIQDLRMSLSTSKIAARFHNSIAALNLEVCSQLRSKHGINHVALSGGVWQNGVLLSKTCQLLTRNGFTILRHHQVPTNDGGIALGQLVVAANTVK